MFGRVLVLAVGLMSGVTASQVPEFAQQYRQRLGGAIDALTEVVEDFRRDAAAVGLSVDAAVSRLQGAEDDLARRRGETMAVTQDRLGRLEHQKQSFEDAGPFLRIKVFFEELDGDLAKSTAEDFEPAVPVTFEGLAAAGAGLIAGLAGMRGLIGLTRLGRRRRRVEQL